MSELDDQIARALRHVEDGRRIVERHRKLFASGKVSDDEFLGTLERSLAIFEDYLARLMRERGRGR